MDRSSTVKVGSQINNGKPYTVKIGTIPKMGRPYTVKVKASYSLEKSLTQLRHKVVNLILRKWKVYDLSLMGRSYIDEVETKNGKMCRVYTVIVGNFF